MEKKENVRPKSPGTTGTAGTGKAQKESQLSIASGNNNNNNNSSTTGLQSQSRRLITTKDGSKRPMSPHSKSQMAREKFQNLLISANKVKEAGGVSARVGSSMRVQDTGFTGVGQGTVTGASNVNNNTTTASPFLKSTLAAGITNNGLSAAQKSLILLNGSSRINVTAGYPNIDPRTFPKPLQQLTHIVTMRQPTQAKSMVGMGPDRSRNLRQYVEKAMAEHKVFSCVGVYPAIKNALKKRGWVEKTGPINVVRSASIGPFRPENVSGEDETDAAWISRNLRDYPPDFIWVIRRDNIDWKGMHKDQMINRFPKAWFTTKVGLTACLQQMHWYAEAGFSETFFPRCYRLCLDDERQAFQEDYRLTACMSYLRYFVEMFETKGPQFLIDPQSRITPLSIDFASRQLGNYVRMRRHEDIDWLLPPNFMSQHWDAFIHQYYLVVHDKKKIRFENLDAVKMKYDIAKKTMLRISPYWPQAHLDGVFNMWICKPGARSRGKGIVIMNSLEKIMELLNQGNYREANWVVQKYMERPLLIYKTKFDMRQWFVITDWSPLTLWFYKESYVRFCTKPFILEDFHESIHLCNNAIQCRYQNADTRDNALPDENMWDCYTFQAYLKSIGKMEQWPKIYSGMKQAIIGVLLASQESVESRKGCFELYGADFMLSEDFNPWLIEINSCPCMSASTSVTARMCAQCLEDCIKVVIDRRTNKNADTGMFEMVYRQPLGAVTVQQFSGHDLVIHGKRLTRDVDWPGSNSEKQRKSKKKRKSSRRLSGGYSSLSLGMMSKASNQNARRASGGTLVATTLKQNQQQANLPNPAENLTFTDLLQKLRMKNTQMFQGFVSNSQAQTLAAISGPDSPDKSLTGTLLNKMRALKAQQEKLGTNPTSNPNPTPTKDSTTTGSNTATSEIIPGMKKVYPTKSPSRSKSGSRDRSKDEPAESSLAHLAKYFEENTSTFANLIRIGNEINDDSPDKDKRPGTYGIGSSQGSNRRPISPGTALGNPYAPRAETAKTVREVRLAVNAASDKFGKIDDDKQDDKGEQVSSPTALVNDKLIHNDSDVLDDNIVIINNNSIIGYKTEEPTSPHKETLPESKCQPDPSPEIVPIQSIIDLKPLTLTPDPDTEHPEQSYSYFHGNSYVQDILNNNYEFPSTSTSSMDDDEAYDDKVALFIPRRFTFENSGLKVVSVTNRKDKNRAPRQKPKPEGQCQNRVKIRNSSSNKFPCHRVGLHKSTATKKSLPVFPIKKINLKLN